MVVLSSLKLISVSESPVVSLDLLSGDILRVPTYDQLISSRQEARRDSSGRTKRQAIKGTSKNKVVDLDDDEHFHGPSVSIPDVSFRDMDSFVAEARKTIEERFGVLEKEIYKSSARQVPGTPEWFMAASTKTKVSSYTYNISHLR